MCKGETKSQSSVSNHGEGEGERGNHVSNHGEVLRNWTHP